MQPHEKENSQDAFLSFLSFTGSISVNIPN